VPFEIASLKSTTFKKKQAMDFATKISLTNAIGCF
jgi:hypothetical protein